MSGDASQPVRVRFAPSPTGYLHVGGARTAIFNWLVARQQNGVFVLRIEDTDVDRSTKQSEDSLIDDLRWLGLYWDEGPEQGGDYGSYRQSERLAVYKAAADRLVENGVAYPCFCSDEILAAKRESMVKAGKPPQYDGTCRDLSAGDISSHRNNGDAEVIRFRVPDGAVRFTDLVRGDIEIQNNTVGDFVLVRSNERPTYNFAAAVDDSAMKITHVLRGEEHLPNTLRQSLIYDALGATEPQFGHLPLILAEDRSKLSKRHGASSVGELRRAGFLSAAVVNYLVLLGWSHPDGQEVLSRDELIKAFSVGRVSKSPAVYDQQKLRWMNAQYIRQTPLETLFEMAEPFFPADIKSGYNTEKCMEILALLHDSLETLGDLDAACAPFRLPPDLDREARDVLKEEDARSVLSVLGAALTRDGHVLTRETFKTLMKEVAKESGQKGKSLFFPVRAAVTGSVHGPDLAGIAVLKGRDQLIKLLERARSL